MQAYLDQHFPSLDQLDTVEVLLQEELAVAQALQQRVDQVTAETTTVTQQLEQELRQANTELDRLDQLYQTLADKKTNSTPAATSHCDVSSSDGQALKEGAPQVETQTDLLSTLTKELSSLQGLLTTQHYLNILMQTYDLQGRIQTEVTQAPTRALALYHQLHELAFELHSGTHPVPLNNCSHLLSFVDQQLQQMWSNIQQVVTQRLVHCLNQLSWPKPIPIPPPQGLGPKLDELQQAFADMLLLERPPSAMALSTPAKKSGSRPPLLAMQVLLRPLLVRFNYHFNGPRPTNQLDKPEWFLTHVTNTIREHYPFLEEELQPVVDQSATVHCCLRNEFIWGWVQAILAKLRGDRGRYLEEPLLVAHTVYQLAEFDRTLSEVYFYPSPTPDDTRTQGSPDRSRSTVEQFLSDQRLFTAWLDAEKEYLADQYNELILDDDAWTILYNDLLDNNEPHPTQSAEALLQLIEGTGLRAQGLPRVRQRLLFLADLQLPLLEAYAQEVDREVQALQQSFFTLVKHAATDMATKAHSTAVGSPATPVLPSSRTGPKYHDPELLDRFSQWCRWFHACWYMSDNLQELAEQPHYLSLGAYVMRYYRRLRRSRDSDKRSTEDQSFSDRLNTVLNATARRSTRTLRTSSRSASPALHVQPTVTVDDLDQPSADALKGEWSTTTSNLTDTSDNTSQSGTSDYGSDPDDENESDGESVGTDDELDDDTIEPTEDGSCTVFDDNIKTFDELTRKVQHTLYKALTQDFITQLRPYRKKTDWSVDQPDLLHALTETAGEDSSAVALPGAFQATIPAATSALITNISHTSTGTRTRLQESLSVELASALTALNHAFTYLAQHLPDVVFQKLYRDFALAVDDFLYYRVILAHTFSFTGALQLTLDLTHGLWSLATVWVPKPANFYRKTKEAVLLLSLPPDESHHFEDSSSLVAMRESLISSLIPAAIAPDQTGDTFPNVCTALFDSHKSRPDKQLALARLGIDYLELEDVQQILRHRVDFTSDL
ncbi:hypothetical protein IWQ62_003715 [Dispira parvispora]|uniref:RAD50-interacting protein 1 n=1 Tax=Dispira parvispora TaxID=1520584 RepID=A0A9W8ATN8_9FUNG|nr:hypothetical protein IWQ62_003715 [Dispira parvispora]